MLLQCLPLREDFEENKTIFECFISLYHIKHAVFMQHLQPAMTLAAMVFNSKQSDTGMFGNFLLVYLEIFPAIR